MTVFWHAYYLYFLRTTCIYILHAKLSVVRKQSGIWSWVFFEKEDKLFFSGVGWRKEKLWYMHSLKRPLVIKSDWLLCWFGPLAFITLLVLPLIQCFSLTLNRAAFILYIIIHTKSEYSVHWSVHLLSCLLALFLFHWPKYIFMWYNVNVVSLLWLIFDQNNKIKLYVFTWKAHGYFQPTKGAVTVEASMSLTFFFFF